MSLAPDRKLGPQEWPQAAGTEGGAARAGFHEDRTAPSGHGLERSRRLGWEYDSSPDISLLDPEQSRWLSFSQARRIGILPVLKDDGTTLVWLHPDFDWDTLLEMQAKLRTDEGKAKYAQRKQTVEPVFGIIKHVIGFRQFLLRGLEKVNGEWSLVALAYNFKRLWKLQTAG